MPSSSWWSPSVSDEDVKNKTKQPKTSSSGRQEWEDKVLRDLFSPPPPPTFNHKPPQQVSYVHIFWSWRIRRLQKQSTQCGTQIKEHLQTLGKKHTNPFLVAGSPIWPGPAASWLIQVFIQQFLSRIQLTLKPAGKWTRPCPLSRRSQWLISSRELSNKSCSNKSQSSFCKHRSGHRNHQPLKLRSLFNCC